MSGRKAKQLRRLVFGEASLRLRFYERNGRTGAIQCRGDRRRYKDLKKQYAAGTFKL